MSATINGRAVLWSTGGITFTAGIVSASNPGMAQSSTFQRTSEKTEIKDDGGTIRTQVFHGFRKTLSITVIPYHASDLSNAADAHDAYLLAPGTKITVVDGAGNIAGDYNLLSSRQGRSVDGVATIDLELEQGDEGQDLTTATTA